MSSADLAATPAATSAATPAYAALTQRYRQLHHLEHLQSLAHWDQASHMPAGAAPARAQAMAELAGLMHRLRTEPAVQGQLAQAGQELLSEAERANLREIERDWRLANALPDALVQRREIATAACEQAWRTQRPANDWAGFLPNLRAVVAVARDEAELLSQLSGERPYDCLLDRFEPGMRCAQLDPLFADLRQWLPDLIQRVLAHQRATPLLPLQGPYPLDAQRALCERVMQLLQFNFDGGRLDISTHPFCGGAPEDVRLTNRYDLHDCLNGLLGAVHETGHGRYEQGRPRDWLGQPLSLARSMGIHESQSLAFEMQLGRHPGFVALLVPLLQQAFGARPEFEAENLRRLLTRVQPGLIRVDADEVSYAPHVMLRYEIERALIEREIEADDIPALWDAGMAELLGLDTRGNHRDGAMQDVHWPAGMFGYFPCYTLGAMYAAQWFAALRRAVPDLDARIALGDLTPVFDWLATHIWQPASRWPTDELALRASGEPLNPAHYRAHLEQRYLGLA